jgi:signal transduction histidine kinase
VIIRNLGNKVVNTALTKEGYGILVDQDLNLIGHPNPDFVGMKMYSQEIPLSILTEELVETGSISEVSFKNWKGESVISFFRTLSNGWRLGLLAPTNVYYQAVYMAQSFSILGIAVAAVLIIILIQVNAARNKSAMESRHKSAFLANMSHEIRTPMNAIIGMTTIGKSAAGSERKDYCLTKIQDVSNHLLGVINDILDLSKIEANKFELSPVEFELEKMLQRIVNVINFRVEEKRQKFSVYIDHSIPRILTGDDQRIAQVITNLLGNAVKFTPEEGTIGLTVRLVEKTNDICTIQVSVSDNGIGINSEQ